MMTVNSDGSVSSSTGHVEDSNATHCLLYTSKFISGNVTYVAAFYILDITMVTIDLVLTIRNKRLDRAAEKEETV